MIKFKANGLKNILLEKSISINKLANDTKINAHVIRSLINDSISISPKNIISLSKVLNASFEQLLLNEFRNPIIINLKKLDSNQIIQILLLQANFKSLHYKNITSYVEHLMYNSSENFYGDFNFSDKCSNIRKNLLGLTQAQLSSILNISETSVHNWEVGNTRPSFNSLFTLSLMTGFTIDYFFTDGSQLEISSYNLTEEKYSILESIIREYYK
ncbi:helix-turn-helix transcriptional regulator [Faecalicoccus pleomorphus]|uniref:helix-turn-helix transcriptional regulator n=1 Tax=Faecalicoccus pleomorphus TaxID=1323 RepID=UPI00195F7041|nr:helix-turn-helix domain-containing protein [Faecalicoccus pleomorphus]